jgi:hypothetical protein
MLGDSTNQRGYDIMAVLRRFDFTSYALSPAYESSGCLAASVG